MAWEGFRLRRHGRHERVMTEREQGSVRGLQVWSLDLSWARDQSGDGKPQSLLREQTGAQRVMLLHTHARTHTPALDILMASQ